jgi:hypothetical protein
MKQLLIAAGSMVLALIAISGGAFPPDPSLDDHLLLVVSEAPSEGPCTVCDDYDDHCPRRKER